jgi:soluble lytic murein transglycosylase
METRNLWGSIRIHRLSCGIRKTAMRDFRVRMFAAALAFSFACIGALAGGRHVSSSSKPVSTAASSGAVAPVFTTKDLEKWSRALKEKNSAQAYAALSAAAGRKSSESLGARAALALGFFDYGQGRFAPAARWFAQAKSDSLLLDYALYWSAQTDLAQGDNAGALAELQRMRQQFPDSVMTDQALQSLGEAALAQNRPQDAVAALENYPLTPQRPALLLLRGEAREKAGDLPGAAADYQSVYMRYALSEQGREAGVKLDFMQGSAAGPTLSAEQRFTHAGILFDAKDWTRARAEYSQILPQLMGVEHERAQLRILECGLSLGGSVSEVASLTVSDPDVDAERFSAVADYYRAAHAEAEMNAAVENAVAKAASSHWAEASLFLAGNYYWVQLDRDRASSYYQRVEENFPMSADADPAQWRVAWTATLEKHPDAAALAQDHIRRFPTSVFTPDALYWLGRLAEDAGAAPLARSYYAKLGDRYPQTYFGIQGAARLRAIGADPLQPADVLASIPPELPIPVLAAKIPAAAMGRQTRADALRSIGFDASAELELRAGYAATGEPRLLLEAAQEAVAAEQYPVAIVTIRQIYPQLEAYSFDEVPREAWAAAYALPLAPSIRRWSASANLDPMLVAALIHQESAFQPEARSGKNAIGLMQLLPTTARKWAGEAKIRYARARLTDPDYNIHLGTVYFAALQKQFGSVEAALAAYNAGEDRVASWTSGAPYRETAEFVDSIPFTETRQYVQIITRNADIYRRLYGEKSATVAPASSSPKKRRHR